MTAATLIAELQTRDVHVWVDGDRLRCNAPVGALTPELKDQLRERKGELLEYLRGPAELSSSQQRLWYLDQVDPGGTDYVIAQAFELQGALDAALLERALALLVSRHESLRTVFATVEGRPLQVVMEPQAWTLQVTQVSEADVRAQLRGEAARSFDLARGPLFGARLYRLAADRHVLLAAMHHIVSDGWSMDILTRELGELYGRLCRGDATPLPALRLQFRDFARWQLGRLGGEAMQRMLSHQVARLAGAPQVIELRTDRPRRAAQRRRGATFSFALPMDLTERLRSLGRREEATLFMTLLAGFTVLLSRYSRQQELLVGTPVANRTRPEVEDVVGCFVNTLVLRADLAGEPNARELLARTQQVCLDAFAHQEVPLERLVEALRPEREPGRNPLFQVMFAMQSAPLRPLELAGLAVRPIDVPRDVTQFDLMLHVEERVDGLGATFFFAADLFLEATIARMAAHWRSLLEGMAATPDTRVSELPMLSESERHQVLVEWNRTAAEYPRDACVHELFQAQVLRTPQAIAIRCADRHLTYEELEGRANRLAHRLRELGVGPDVLVGIYVHRSIEMVVGLLGILKAGGAYVPIDPGYPAERVAFMLADAQAPVVLTQAHLMSRLPSGAATVCLDADAHTLAHLPESAPTGLATAANLAYVVYTSGSTGKPKGACITHRGLVNYLSWAVKAYAVAEGNGAPVHSSIAFDLTVTSLFTPLLCGQSVELLPDDQGVDALAGALRVASNYSLVKLTPAHLQLLPFRLPADEAAGRARTLVIGGEQLQAEAIAFWREHAPQTVLVNEYGPTETVVGCCTYRVTHETRNSGAIPIGRPIANTRLYILDRNMQPVPIGVAGELYIGGDGVARGYLHRPELTNERFVADPFCPPERLYRTGDLARYLADGNIEFLGREDDQVKLHGFRVELGEIESALAGLAQVQEAVVALREDATGEPRLVAYVVLRAGQDAPGELRQALKQQLPDHMMPSRFVVLDRLPLTEHGKVDRRALPAPVRQLGDASVPPRTEWERKLAAAWQDVLRVENVGVNDDFFELGGNSLMTVRLISEINRRHQVSLGVAEVLQNPTVAQMAQLVDGQRRERTRHSAVVELRPGRAGVPVYFIYAGPDEFRLAQRMDERHPVFGIEAPWPLPWRDAVAANRRSGFPTMHQLVAPFVAALCAHARTRPFVLVGHSFGGLLAFEAAHEVRRRGGNLELVILLDTWARPPAPHQVAWHNWRKQWGARAAGRTVPSIASRLRHSWCTTRWLLEQAKGRVESLFDRREQGQPLLSTVLDEEGMPVPVPIVSRAYAKVARSYHPRPLDSRGVLFRSDSDDNAMLRGFDDSHGWSNLFARGLEIVPMVGDHISMIRRHQQKLAREMDEVLRRHGPLPADNGAAVQVVGS